MIYTYVTPVSYKLVSSQILCPSQSVDLKYEDLDYYKVLSD